MLELNRIIQGDCLEELKKLPDQSVNCCVTSPPYYGLRDYGKDGQIGLESTPDEYVLKMVDVFAEVKRVLINDGTLWLNLGDSYNGYPANVTHGGELSWQNQHARQFKEPGYGLTDKGLKPKDLIGIPWMVAFALRADGWYLRQDIIWHKPNPMPESVTDRCTKAHEYIFLMSKSSKYYYDAESIKSDAKPYQVPQNAVPVYLEKSRYSIPGQVDHSIMKISGRAATAKAFSKTQGGGGTSFAGHSGNFKSDGTPISNGFANKRSVWTVNTMPYSEAHFATFPERLILDCIKAGCPVGGVVLDPFMGAGTTALVSRKLDRNYLGIELNPGYIEIANKRLKNQLGMFL